MGGGDAKKQRYVKSLNKDRYIQYKRENHNFRTDYEPCNRYMKHDCTYGLTYRSFQERISALILERLPYSTLLGSTTESRIIRNTCVTFLRSQIRMIFHR